MPEKERPLALMDLSGSELPWEQVISLLAQGRIEITGQFVHGSNYTFLVTLSDETSRITAVYKPVRGENPLWDFPNRTLAKRETAAFVLSERLGWRLVPPTVFRKEAPLGAGSLQFFVEHDINRHYFSLPPARLEELHPVVLFDVIANNADRKGSHLIFDSNGRLWLIDHGLCFNIEEKLRTVIWDFAGEPVPLFLLQDLERILPGLQRGEEMNTQLHFFLSFAEIKALEKRVRAVLTSGTYPLPPADRRAYPYPPL